MVGLPPSLHRERAGFVRRGDDARQVRERLMPMVPPLRSWAAASHIRLITVGVLPATVAVGFARPFVADAVTEKPQKHDCQHAV